jgi:ArsR family transcriptional regulator
MIAVLRSPFRREPFTATDADRLAHMLKVIADPARLRIINALAKEGPQRGSDLVAELGLSQSTIAHHLSVLADAGMVVETNRAGREVWRGLDIDAVARLVVAVDPFGGRR